MEDNLHLKGEFTKPECDRFRELCNFTEDERKVFDLRVTGRSIIEISIALCMAEATVNRRIRAIKNKIYEKDLTLEIAHRKVIEKRPEPDRGEAAFFDTL